MTFARLAAAQAAKKQHGYELPDGCTLAAAQAAKK